MTAVMDHPEQRPTQPQPRPAWTLTGDQTLTELDDLHEALTRLSARRLELLAHLDSVGHARDLGARDTTELISLRHRLDPQHVRRDLKTAKALLTLPVVATQLPGYPTPADAPNTEEPPGDDATDTASDPLMTLVDRRRASQVREVALNSAQAAVIAEILAKVPTHVPAENAAVAEAELVIAARSLLPRDLRRLGRSVLNTLDTDGPPPSDDSTTADDPRSTETLWWQPGTVPNPAGASGPSSRVTGLRFGGFLTGENAELFQTLIDAAAKPRKTPSGELDPRTLGQRRADAFAIVLRAAAATGGEIPAHGGIKPHLSVTIPYTAITTLAPTSIATTLASTSIANPRANPAPDSVENLLAGLSPDPVVAPLVGLGPVSGTGLLVFGDPLPVNDVRRIACDAGVIPIVLGAHGEPLDVGREQRLVTPAIRRALIARDGGCVIPGCGAPPGHCDAHHLIHWADGGITAVTNLALVCPTHHRAIHRGVWIVTIVDGQVQITRPGWTEPGPSG